MASVYNEKISIIPSESLWILEALYSWLGYDILAHLPSDMKFPSFQWGPEQEKAFQ